METEVIYRSKLRSLADLEQANQEYVSFYNHESFQKKLNDRSPLEYRETATA
ncbi:IS3 family transposase [Paenibacillus sp. QZ-Y1]|uniref:IS3 family transposase n=1 Tax=Paenibacillus sp. QZ-Y1 TaxID=3414511 RepID=UPI003F7A9540